MIRLTVPVLEQRRLLARFWRGANGFWGGSSAWTSWSLAALLLMVVLLQLLVQFQLNVWQRDFYDALEARRAATIWHQAQVFVGLVVASTGLAVAVTWGRMTAQRLWRSWLTEILVRDWLARIPSAPPPAGDDTLRSPEYRIAEDANVATQLPVDFAIGLITALLGALTFIGVLWSVGGDFVVPAFGATLTIPGYLVIAAIVYALVNTTAMLLIGRRLVLVIEEKNQAEAELRQAGTYLREDSEGTRHEASPDADGRTFAMTLGRVNTAWRYFRGQLMRTLLISHGSSLLAPLIALTLCVPKYLAGDLSLGEVMQLAAAFVIVQSAFNWLVDNYPRIAEWLSSVNRVALLLASLDR
ncbi:MAG: ABC transporter [Proteobacteria bacterium]|nr:ABC transporter [Pseudomonadota bacterium]